MNAPATARPSPEPLARLFTALCDPARGDAILALLLGGYVVLWTLYAVITEPSGGIHADMGEMFALSRQFLIGTPKHPPLGSWLVGAWFSVFPREDWAYYLFAMTVAAIGLWTAWRVAAPYLRADKRLIGVLLLTFVPFYNFHALRFNANTVLIPCWAATTWFFLRSLETRRSGWAVLAGIAAAASMLGKYWSICLLVGLGITALADARRGAYFRSAAPWLTVAVGALLLAPHVVWLVANGFLPFKYAVDVHGGTVATAARSSLVFVVESLAYGVVPIAFCLATARPSARAIGDTLWPADTERRTVVVAFAAPLVFAALAAVPLRVNITSLWAMSNMTLLPVVLLSSPLLKMPRRAGPQLLAAAIAFPLLMLALSPGIAVVVARQGTQAEDQHYRLIAHAVDRAWRVRTNKPLHILGGASAAIGSVGFYLTDPPSIFDIVDPRRTPWVAEGRIRRDGIAIECPERNARCLAAMRTYAARYRGAQSETIVLPRRFIGATDAPVCCHILIVPPQ